MRLVSFAIASLLLLAACGSDTTSGSPSSELDRSDPEEVAVAMVTAFLQSDYTTLRDVVLPAQRESVDAIEEAAALGPKPKPEVEIVSVTATVLNRTDDTATVKYTGEYCLPESTDEVPVTASVPGGLETVPGSTVLVECPRQCFKLEEIFQTESFELQLIDGDWHAPLPS